MLVASFAFAAPTMVTTPAPNAAALPLGGEGTSITRIVRVAELQIDSNDAQGFSLTVSSGFLGKAGGQTPIPFQVITVAADQPSPTAADFTLCSGASHVFSTSGPGSVRRAIYIRYTSSALQDPGAYDTAVEVNVVENQER